MKTLHSQNNCLYGLLFLSAIAVSLPSCGQRDQNQKVGIVKVLLSREDVKRIDELEKIRIERDLSISEMNELHNYESKLKRKISTRSAVEMGQGPNN